MNGRQVNILIIKVTLLIAFGLLLCESHMVVYWFAPDSAKVMGNWWVDKSYHYEVSALWFIYEMSNRLAIIMWFYAFSKVCELISRKLFKVVLTFTIYFISQFAFWIWDRNEIVISNLIVYLYMIIAIWVAIKKTHEPAKIINLN